MTAPTPAELELLDMVHRPGVGADREVCLAAQCYRTREEWPCVTKRLIDAYRLTTIKQGALL